MNHCSRAPGTPLKNFQHGLARGFLVSGVITHLLRCCRSNCFCPLAHLVRVGGAMSLAFVRFRGQVNYLDGFQTWECEFQIFLGAVNTAEPFFSPSAVVKQVCSHTVGAGPKVLQACLGQVPKIKEPIELLDLFGQAFSDLKQVLVADEIADFAATKSVKWMMSEEKGFSDLMEYLFSHTILVAVSNTLLLSSIKFWM